ncbi:NF-X1-type zinc finger protein NFXL1 [Orussus abietinus]|uniref:NF-X1-type zinc finger protein NFXL1 n=1 Tax=Orussus abietinus TaxID=222816 RepID=UPI0006265D8B|nr:NF-X1-type zinc finger protein NFXL1 [Orussus abietinus]XP_012279264.1 NF-X1-type zinc finger protein NFXL1 [Orussus abietinus]XP_012279265.1 NF-X1-type zinc finger protein NFXL1 [Orussus abietinus]XP_012279266.1 NF-X1-type zinc finger protein NFXL1 [Orussus abietinus]
MNKFKRVQAQNRASIERHLEEHPVTSSSSEDEDEGTTELLEKAVGNVLSSYRFKGGDAEKILSYLSNTFQSGGAVCLICISSVKKVEAIWSCIRCFSFMHLPCIQHWIRDSLNYKREREIAPVWACPKCRAEYRDEEIPREYRCFCGKTSNPLYQPWLIPHSCGEACEKPLEPRCGHRCILLCHPGPCPPCPQMVTSSCYCGKRAGVSRRCNAREWSCGSVCGKLLECAEHRCRDKCHPGDCSPCSETVEAPCRCGAEAEARRCSESKWVCERPCATPLSCGVHRCEGFCHRAGDCGSCPLEGNRTCPCGKKRYVVSCKEEDVPTCGDTCGKRLECGRHSCSMRCHYDGCGQCLQVVVKACRCGAYKKEVACAKEFHCNTKCTRMRPCGRHPCNRKCCDCQARDAPTACEKVCERILGCRRHKCAAPCHPGPCYPCGRTNVVQCRCGGSQLAVPCGTRKRISPPSCDRPCGLASGCHHPQPPHRCHQGPCPPCRAVCDLAHAACGHACPAICHARVWVRPTEEGASRPVVAVGPWQRRPPKSERRVLRALPCPPCEVPVPVTCFGEHETLPRPCHLAVPDSCARECARPLTCANHRCARLCHRPGAPACDSCERPCELPRPEGCTHACARPCHPAPCEPCQRLVKVSCHCGINALYRRCSELTLASPEAKRQMLACGNQCPKNYSCGHRCVDGCHEGPCPREDLCDKRVKVWCKCKRIKRDFSCEVVRLGKATVDCDGACLKRKEEREQLQAMELEKRKAEEETRNRMEIEKFERKFKPKRRGKARNRFDDGTKESRNFFCRKIWLPATAIVAIAVATVYVTVYV